MKKIAVYGGTFSPVHNGHVAFVSGYIKLENPDKLYVVPTFSPPHKPVGKTDQPKHRLEMVRLAFSEIDSRILISDFEINRKAPSYTVHTLEHFSAPDTELTFLCGSDMFLTLEEWHRTPDIFKLCKIAFARRTDGGTEYSERITERRKHYERVYGAEIIELPLPVIDISSTGLRAAVCRGESIAELVPEKVNKYILDNRLYR